MSDTADLSIVIPAYKARYLDAALGSISEQQDQGFRVHIGDDASPDDLTAVCRRWQDRVPLVYHRFEHNLGGRDLVAQWHRCIALGDQPWVWLFSDDDVMEPGCVRAWREAQGREPQADVFHFDVLRIDGEGQPLRDEPAFADRLSARRFLLQRLRFELSSYAPDYVFRRSAFQAAGGFQSFPLAWCSDDATWIKLAARGGGIRAVRGARVHWRLSDANISQYANTRLASLKLEAWVQFLEWLDGHLAQLPLEPGDPDDTKLRGAARYWLYQQAGNAGIRFAGLPRVALARRLGKLQQHSLPGALLRMLRSDWQLACAR
ncbi:MAG: glycosyltransferase family 2 protein [Burkholderiaceae bacterium]|nr:glycosyltransferase family 2 protein [Burkholderiaceae bacterium]